MKSLISSIGTAVPKNKLSQKQILAFMNRHLCSDEEAKKHQELIYRASGIEFRHSVIADFGKDIPEYHFFPKNLKLEPFPRVSSRMGLYKREALKLALQAIENSITVNDLQQITHLITVSCTGMYAPGIDIELIEELGLSTEIQRTAINFMGCYAAFNALKVGDSIIQANPESHVLVVAVELCSIHLLKNTNEDSILSNALFGDGAAAVLMKSELSNTPSFTIEQFYSNMDTSGKNMMSWHIDDFGFDMKLTHEVPGIIKKGIKQLTEKLLAKVQLNAGQINHYAIHPGGKKILRVIEEELGIDKAENRLAYHVLKNYGNMSSPTVLFVLKELMNELTNANKGENVLSFAFGPGLTLESMLLKVV